MDEMSLHDLCIEVAKKFTEIGMLMHVSYATADDGVNVSQDTVVRVEVSYRDAEITLPSRWFRGGRNF
jgi:hypothetical protein